MVNARLGGDITGLKDVFRGFNEAAKAQHFFLDRRSFRPEFTVASVSLPTDPTFLDRLEWEADSYRGPDWRVTTCSLLSAAVGHDAPTFVEVETLHLGVGSG